MHIYRDNSDVKNLDYLKIRKGEEEVGRLPSNRSDWSVERKNWPAGHLSSFRIRAMFLNTSNSISVAAYRLRVSVPLGFIPLTAALHTIYSSLELSRLKTRLVLINPGEKRCARNRSSQY